MAATLSWQRQFLHCGVQRRKKQLAGFRRQLQLDDQ
jgi:hypothetical protein